MKERRRGLRWPITAAGVLGCATAVVACTPHAAATTTADHPVHLVHEISGGDADLGQAELDVVSGASIVSVSTTDLRGSLYRITTPKGAGVAPVATMDGDVVEVSLAFTGRHGASSVAVVLNSRVSWRIRLDGGASEESVDMMGGRLTGLAFGAGSTHIEAELPKPVGTIAVTMSGGAADFQLHLPGGVPARVLFDGGAGSAVVDGVSKSGVAGGTVLATPGWPAARNRYEIDNTAGVSQLTLDRGPTP
ncbi:MAG TPA: hypothetical protein VHV74_04190 [Pseudonocardiaceae bacterium]|jgi:hypothetical protein|nr:hypothetical protein [Pseudonocardiaceae bacterium]